MHGRRLIIALLLANVAGLAILIALSNSTPRAIPKATPASPLTGRDPQSRAHFPGAVPNLEEQPPFTGPTPTRDTRTWRLIDPGYVLGALVELDSRAGFEISPQQARACIDWTKLVRASEAETNDAECLFTQIVPHVLTPAQNHLVTLQVVSLERRSIDMSALVSNTRALAQREPTARPSPFEASPRPAPASVGTYLAALEMLEKPGADALTPAQAATLVPPLERVVRATEARVVNYERLCAIVTDAQARELTQILADVHSGRLDASTVFQNLREGEIWLQKRAAP